jgi:cytochrome c oxidase subunit 4
MSEASKTAAPPAGTHRVDPNASSNADPHAGHHVPMSTFNIIIILLMVLLVVTVAAAFVPLGELNMIVAMTIACIKALLVILFFMHVKYSSRLTKVFVAASFLWLAILFALTFPDYISRGWLSNSSGWEDNPIKNAYRAGTEHAEHGGKHEAGAAGSAVEKPAESAKEATHAQ